MPPDRAPERDPARDPGPPPARRSAVLFDFYGTLARATHWVSADSVLAERGYRLDDHLRRRWFDDGIDGVEHLEHSRSRDHYLAWQQERTLAMLAETDVHPDEYEEILLALRSGASSRVLEPYDEVHEVLGALRARDVLVVVCSNWDWDLREAVEEAGLADVVDVMMSSAWAGARKPHPRIYARTLEEAGLASAAGALFVGDTWGPDVEGPLRLGMRPVYLRRDGHWDDATCPHDDPGAHPDVVVARDLRLVLQLV